MSVFEASRVANLGSRQKNSRLGSLRECHQTGGLSWYLSAVFITKIECNTRLIADDPSVVSRWDQVDITAAA